MQASNPQQLKQFYEKNQDLKPNIPSKTSSEFRDLLLRLLKRNPRDRMEFDDFFAHPFLRISSLEVKEPQLLHESVMESLKNADADRDSPLPARKDKVKDNDSNHSSTSTDDYILVPSNGDSAEETEPVRKVRSTVFSKDDWASDVDLVQNIREFCGFCPFMLCSGSQRFLKASSHPKPKIMETKIILRRSKKEMFGVEVG